MGNLQPAPAAAAAPAAAPAAPVALPAPPPSGQEVFTGNMRNPLAEKYDRQVDILFPDGGRRPFWRGSQPAFERLREWVKHNETSTTAAMPGSTLFHAVQMQTGATWTTEETAAVGDYLCVVLFDPSRVVDMEEQRRRRDAIRRQHDGELEAFVKAHDPNFDKRMKALDKAYGLDQKPALNWREPREAFDKLILPPGWTLLPYVEVRDLEQFIAYLVAAGKCGARVEFCERTKGE